MLVSIIVKIIVSIGGYSMNDKVKISRKKLYLSMIKLAIPLIISNFLQNLYNLADTYYMGKLGGIELATASFTSPITQMIIGAGTGFSLGGGVILSQTFGSKNIKKLVEVNTQLIVVNMVIAIIITVLSFGFCEKILVFSGATGVLLEKSSLYIKFIFLTIPMTFIVTAYTVIKNSKGKTSAPLHLITVSVILNIILNSFFIYKMNLQNDNRIFLSLASASANYTKPDAVMDAFTSWLGQELPEFACMIHRLEVYADLGNEKKHKFVSLESLGVEVQ